MTPRDEAEQDGAADESDRHNDGGSTRTPCHHHRHRHHRRRGHEGRRGRRQSHDQRRASGAGANGSEDDGLRSGSGSLSSEESFSESGSTSCSTASSYSVDYPEPRGRGRRHRHHHRSHALADGPVRYPPSHRMSMQSIPVTRRSTGRRLQVVIDQPETSSDGAGEAGEESRGRPRSTTEESSGSSDGRIVQADEDGSNVRARQEALNTRHPFGLPIWKPALYKKSRTVTRAAFLALHARPLRSGKLFLKPGNIAWLLVVGWWLMLVCLAIAAVLFAVPCGGRHYARVTAGLGWYLLWPFGRYVERIKHGPHELDCSAAGVEEATDGASALEAGGGDDAEERAPLLSGHTADGSGSASAAGPACARFRRQTMLGRAVYYILLVSVLNPILTLVSALSWFAVFSIPMGKLTHTLTRYLWRDPLSLHFRSDDLPTVKVQRAADGTPAAHGGEQATGDVAGATGQVVEQPAPTVLLCTNDAMGWYYYKYTVDGVNILFYNMLSVAVFVLLAAFIIGPLTHHQHPLVQPGVLFPLCLVSTIPLAYFIGQGVSSISAQSSLGMGAVINATFGSIVEVILYSIALTQGKAQLVQGALIGSLLAGLMLMPGTSMIAGGVKHKVQRFNAKSAEVTATLVIMSIIGAFAPTLFYHTFAVPEFVCRDEAVVDGGTVRRCRQTNTNFLDDPFYQTTVKPFMYFCTAILPLAYLIALWFSLKTHVSHIYSSGQTSNPIIRHILELFRRTVGPDASNRVVQRMHLARPDHALAPLSPNAAQPMSAPAAAAAAMPAYLRSEALAPDAGAHDHGASREHPGGLVESPSPVHPESAPWQRQPPQLPQLGRSTSYTHGRSQGHHHHHHHYSSHGGGAGAPQYGPADAPSSLSNVPRLSELPRVLAADPDDQLPDLALLEHMAAGGVSAGDGEGHGGHDAPNWSKAKSAFILCACTVVFSLIAEVLVDTVDVVIQDVGIREKYIGLTLFALVPNVTEFLNAIAFAIQGNIALSIEISNAYTVQVALLQIPILVFFSAFYGVPDFVASPSAGAAAGALESVRSAIVRWMSAPLAGRALSGAAAASEAHLPTDAESYVFALLFPRWDLISILFCVFLLTYMLIEGRANYFKGSILCLSYCVWLVSYAFEPIRQPGSD
ncbi:hypothetical protein LPJ61_001239 [Coemansia biformis]|uniref:Sodium/calcium exchanger membrane region domain-containing protein n=1 Tax=Coemansia biformis TaxID=1286918 RepID=A0A9W8D0U9_9FUNG|nr:hypothetical protein LPJ61_001239 [Coemansia biformis]